LLTRLLFGRGINLEVDYEKGIHDPFLMKDMKKAVERILSAIGTEEKIVIFSDYDADGIPGAVVLHDFFKKISENFSVRGKPIFGWENYIPHRGDEGFGLNHEAIEEFAKTGVKLLITIDCGVTDVEEIIRAKEKGIDVIITDHHEPHEKIPPALAILNPKQRDCAYPDKNLCGAGVVFKLVQALCFRLRSDLELARPTPARQSHSGGERFQSFGRGTWNLGIPAATFHIGWEKWLLDMVGLATLSDMVPLIGENRVFAHYGLLVLRKSRRFGLQQLLRRLKINQKFLTEDDIGFMIAPRINAASRMGKPMDAFKLLIVEDEVEAGRLAEHLDKINQERKGAVAVITKEVRKIMLTRQNERRVIVVGNPNWRPSLLGLVANALKEKHNKPVFLWGRDGNATLKGSCRSDGVNVMELMTEAREVFVEFGGHSLSGGFTVVEEKIHILEEILDKACEQLPKIESTGAASVADAALSLDEINVDTYGLVEKLAPFGVGNPKPIFLLKNVSPKTVRQFGKEGNHLEIIFENNIGEAIKAIGFFQTAESFSKSIKVGEPLNLTATLEKSYFRQTPEIRLRIVDIF